MNSFTWRKRTRINDFGQRWKHRSATQRWNMLLISVCLGINKDYYYLCIHITACPFHESKMNRKAGQPQKFIDTQLHTSARLWTWLPEHQGTWREAAELQNNQLRSVVWLRGGRTSEMNIFPSWGWFDLHGHNGFMWINASAESPRHQQYHLLIDTHIIWGRRQPFRSTRFKVSWPSWRVEHKITRLNSALKVSK